MNPLAIGTALVLAASLAANAWLFHQRDSLRDELSTAKGELQQSQAAAQACSAGVSRLMADNDAEIAARRKAVEAAAAAGAELQRARQRAANATLARAPSDASDLCKSALDLSREKIRERGAR